MNKYIIAALFAITFGCASTKNTTPTDAIKLISATQQKWHAGRPEGGSGTNYELKVILQVDYILFDSLYLRNSTNKVGVMNGNKITESYTVGDTLTLKVGLKKNKSILKPNESFAENEGMLTYRVKDKKHQLGISNFTVLKELYYP